MALLRPEEQTFAAMLDGWRNQQLARNLAFSTISSREKTVETFTRHADAYPWQWMPRMVDEWLGDLRAVRNLKRTTLRGYQEAVRSFCGYLIDPAYGWPAECEQRFGSHPVQVCFEANTAVHTRPPPSATAPTPAAPGPTTRQATTADDPTIPRYRHVA